MKSKTFKGGIYPPEEKKLTEDSAFEYMSAPEQIFVPLSQHLGKPSIPQVKKGSKVATGSIIGAADGLISAPVHSPVCGTVAGLCKQTNVTGFPKDAVVINTDGQTEKLLLEPLDPFNITPDQIRERVAAAGIVGQGGAAFPTSVKLSPPKGKILEYIILNGCECEPYLTRDYRFMVERQDAVIAGLKLIMKALDIGSGIIGIEENKPKAISVMQKAAWNEKDLSVISLKTKYPQGAEKMLIKAVTGREVPPGKLPMDVGVVIQNIGTAVAISDAVIKGEPLTTAAITVTGRGIKNPKNLIVPIGTPISDIIQYCGGLTEDAVKIIVGGPMMGVAQYDMSTPVMKATSGIIILSKQDVSRNEETPCLKCGRCVDACPFNLMPTRLVRYTQLGRYEEAEQHGITVCMECGTCAFECPANIPLVQWLRFGKQKVIQTQKERKTSAN